MAHSCVKNNPSLTSEASKWLNSKIRIAKNTFWYHWAKAGILHLGDLYENVHIVTFELKIFPAQVLSPFSFKIWP